MDKKFIAKTILGVAGVVFMALLVRHSWTSLPSSAEKESSEAKSMGAISTTCDNIYRDYPLKQTSTLVNGGRKFTVDWTVAEGRVIFINQQGVESPPIGPKDRLGGDFVIVRWKAAGSSAVVTARFRC